MNLWGVKNKPIAPPGIGGKTLRNTIAQMDPDRGAGGVVRLGRMNIDPFDPSDIQQIGFLSKGECVALVICG